MSTDNNKENVKEDLNSQEEVVVNENESQQGAELTLEEQLVKAQEKIDELNDKYLRQVAEFDNYRKRVIKEKAELIKNGGEKIVTSILPVLDDFDRAEANIEKMADVESLNRSPLNSPECHVLQSLRCMPRECS